MDKKKFKKLVKVLKGYGQVIKDGGSIKIENEGKPSFMVEIYGKQAKVSPFFGRNLKLEEWFQIAEKEALVIEKAIINVLQS